MTPQQDRSVVAVIAPRGYGKTTLVIQHARHLGRRTIWVSLDQYDNDIVMLIEKIADAIEQANGQVESLKRALQAPGASIWARLMPRVRVALASLSNPLVVFDDIQEIVSGDAVDAISWLLLRGVPSTHFVVAGRSNIAIPISRLRLEKRVAEIGLVELAFDDEEAHALLAAHGVQASAEETAQLNDRCEGWPAGLTLATLPHGTHGSAPPPLVVLSGREQPLSDYLRSELLATVTPSHADFMLQTSVLHRMSGELCDHVLGRSDSGSVLRELERSNAFVMALDPEGAWYRSHDLVREALLAELGRVDSMAPALLRSRAAEWYGERKMPVEAVQYEVDSGDDISAARMMATHAQEVYGRGRSETLIAWLEWADDRRVLDADPALTLTGAIGLAISGDADRAVRFGRALESIEDSGPLSDGSPGIDAWKALVRGTGCEWGVDQAVADAQRACDLIPASSRMRRPACASLGMAWMMAGDEAQAEQALTEVTEGSHESLAPNAQASALGLRALMALRVGDLASGRSLFDRAEEVRRNSHIEEQGPQALQDALAARLALARGDVDTARKRLVHAQGLRSLLTWAMPAMAAITRLELGRAHLAMADAPGARTIMLEVRDILHRRPHLGTLVEEATELQNQLAEVRGGIVGASTLTEAELRLVPLLATHLSFVEIGSRLHISRNTVKTETMSLYRKLDATSRREAVEHAAQVGLLDPAAVTAALFASGDP